MKTSTATWVMRPGLLAVTLAVLLGASSRAEAPFAGKPYSDGDLYADTWVATDALGREQPGIDEAGPVREDKWVGIFYWTWHVPRGTMTTDPRRNCCVPCSVTWAASPSSTKATSKKSCPWRGTWPDGEL
jgi:hypothetical protein